MNKIIKNMLLCIIVLGLFFQAVIAAETNHQKDEVVYVSLDLNGEIAGVYVVNLFDVPTSTTILDYGDYDSVQNLSSLTPLQYHDKVIQSEASKGKFFYQGNHPQATLPWQISINYLLNNQPITPQQLAGESGTVIIDLQVMPNANANPQFTNYYLAQLVVEIDTQKAIVTKAEEATLAYEGSVQILNYTLLPTKSLQVQIELEASFFEMNPIKFSAIPFNMNMDLGDAKEFPKQLAQLEAAISQINLGADALSLGSSQLANHSSHFVDALYQVDGGLFNAYLGQGQLLDGSGAFHNGLSQLANGLSDIDKLQDGFGELVVGLQTLKEGSATLADGLSRYETGLMAYMQGVGQVAAGQQQLTDGLQLLVNESQQLREGGAQLVAGSGQIYEGLQFLDHFSFLKNITNSDMQMLGLVIDQILQFWEQAEQTADSMKIDEMIAALLISRELLVDVIESLQTLLNMLQQQISGMSDLSPEALEQMNQLILAMKDKLEAAKAKLELLDQYLETLPEFNQSMAELVQAIKQKRLELIELLKPLKQALAQFDAKKAYQLIQQLVNFREAYHQFHTGLVAYTNGTNQLLDALELEILPGAQQINHGLQQLNENNSPLTAAVAWFLFGVNQMDEGISRILSELKLDDLEKLSQLKAGVDLLLTNHQRLLDGQQTLKDGLSQLSNGLGELLAGYQQFDAGIQSVDQGMSSLSDGTALLSSQTDGMGLKAQQQLDEALKLFSKDGFEKVSFVDERNRNVGLVQFVYVSNALIKPTVVEQIEKQPEPSFWEKLWDIISFWD